MSWGPVHYHVFQLLVVDGPTWARASWMRFRFFRFWKHFLKQFHLQRMADQGAENVRFNRLSSDATGQIILSSGCKAMADQRPSARSRRAHQHENSGRVFKSIISSSHHPIISSSDHPILIDYTDLTQPSPKSEEFTYTYVIIRIVYLCLLGLQHPVWLAAVSLPETNWGKVAENLGYHDISLPFISSPVNLFGRCSAKSRTVGKGPFHDSCLHKPVDFTNLINVHW